MVLLKGGGNFMKEVKVRKAEKVDATAWWIII